MNFLVTRSGYCSHCFQAGRPHNELMFVTFGSQHQQYAIHLTDHEFAQSRKGYVPLLYEKTGIEQLPSGLFVKYQKTCCCVGCGISMTTIEDKKADLITFVERMDEGKKYKIYFYRQRWQHGMMAVNDWNALVSLWHDYTGYALD